MELSREWQPIVGGLAPAGVEFGALRAELTEARQCEDLAHGGRGGAWER